MPVYQSINQLMKDGLVSNLPASHRLPSQLADPTLTGTGSLRSCFAVSEFSQSAIAAAVSQLQQLRHECWGIDSPAVVDRALGSQWCRHSAIPVGGWSLPASWDEFAADYATQDGWIRLHTNAPHHRHAALSVLGKPKNKRQAIASVTQWQGAELEAAVVRAGGAAAVMYSAEQWALHEQGAAVQCEPLVGWQVRDSKKTLQAPVLTDVSRPLKGLRVLDLTRVLAGPVCTRFLASFGASVLRIDPPSWQEDANILEMTVGKRCAGLDLTVELDRNVFTQLLRQAHVLVHGYRADALDALGMNVSWRQSVNPGLIETTLNAYGWTGPWVNRRGFDSLVQMSSGIADSGQREAQADAPVPLPFQALDHATGYLMAAASLYSLRILLTRQQVASARLSLARQAVLLQQMNEVPSEENMRKLDESDIDKGIESSPLGRLRRYRFPYSFSDMKPEFEETVSALRTSSAIWPDDT